MFFTVLHAGDLINAIHAANANPAEEHVINLDGYDASYLMGYATADYFGGTAFPIIQSSVTINGNGRIITRMDTAPVFRFFAVNAKLGGHVNARLTLNQLTLCNGSSGSMGGGAIVNDGALVLNQCVLRDNSGALGGAIYNGDGQSTTITGCVFEHNAATVKAAAIYSAYGSELYLDSTIFTENHTPDNHPAIHFAGQFAGGQEKIRITKCSLWNGIAFEHIGYGDIKIDSPTESRTEDPLQLLKGTMHESAADEEIRRKWATEMPVYQFPPPWWTRQIITPDAQQVLMTIAETQNAPEHVVESLLFTGEIDKLYDLAIALHAKHKQLDQIQNALSWTAQTILRKLAFTPGVANLEALLRLPLFPNEVRSAELAALIAAGQSVETIVTFFERSLPALFDKPDQTDDEAIRQWYKIIHLFQSLAQEVVIRGVNGDEVPAIREFVARQRSEATHYAKDLGWLPLRLMEIERELAENIPIYDSGEGESYSMSFSSIFYTADTPIPPRRAEKPLPQFVETTTISNITQISTAHQVWRGDCVRATNPEVRTFVFDHAIEETDITADLLLALDLACVRDAARIDLLPVTPGQIANELFTAACHGGAYSEGIFPASARLRLWQSIAGLVDAPPDTPVETLAQMTQACRWFQFLADSQWFQKAGWDVGIVVLRPDCQSLASLAATDTD